MSGTGKVTRDNMELGFFSSLLIYLGKIEKIFTENFDVLFAAEFLKVKGMPLFQQSEFDLSDTNRILHTLKYTHFWGSSYHTSKE